MAGPRSARSGAWSRPTRAPARARGVVADQRDAGADSLSTAKVRSPICTCARRRQASTARSRRTRPPAASERWASGSGGLGADARAGRGEPAGQRGAREQPAAADRRHHGVEPGTSSSSSSVAVPWPRSRPSRRTVHQRSPSRSARSRATPRGRRVDAFGDDRRAVATSRRAWPRWRRHSSRPSPAGPLRAARPRPGRGCRSSPPRPLACPPGARAPAFVAPRSSNEPVRCRRSHFSQLPSRGRVEPSGARTAGVRQVASPMRARAASRSATRAARSTIRRAREVALEERRDARVAVEPVGQPHDPVALVLVAQVLSGHQGAAAVDDLLRLAPRARAGRWRRG